MSIPDYSTNEKRIKLLIEASRLLGGNAGLGRKLGFKDGSFVGQMINGQRPVTEKTYRKLTEIPELRTLFTLAQGSLVSDVLPTMQNQSRFDRLQSMLIGLAAIAMPLDRASRMEVAELLKQLCMAPDSEIVRADVLKALFEFDQSGKAAAAA